MCFFANYSGNVHAGLFTQLIVGSIGVLIPPIFSRTFHAEASGCVAHGTHGAGSCGVHSGTPAII